MLLDAFSLQEKENNANQEHSILPRNSSQTILHHNKRENP
jgi:hypothetical protein